MKKFTLLVIVGLAFSFFGCSKVDPEICQKDLLAIRSLIHEQGLPSQKGVAGLKSLKPSSKYPNILTSLEEQEQIYNRLIASLTDDTNAPYFYIGFGLENPDKMKSVESVPVLVDRPGNHQGGIHVVYADGHVMFHKGNFKNITEVITQLVPDSVPSRKLLLENAAWADQFF